jgi:hypothetical protein
VANTSIKESLPSIFIVSPGSVVREYSEYLENKGNSFFRGLANITGTTVPYLPQDAGQLVIDITANNGTFVFAGQTNFTFAPGARGGQADVAAQNIQILGSGDDTVQPGYVGIQASQLNAIGAQSLLVGGLRNVSSSGFTAFGVAINPIANNIVVGPNARLQGPEIMLVGTGGITLQAGAEIDTTGFAPIPAQFPLNPITGQTLGSINLSSSAAFLLASNATLDSQGNPLPVIQRAGTNSIVIDPGAQIYGGTTLFLGAQTITADSSARFGGRTVTVQAPTINFGVGGSGGLTMTNSLLTALSQGDTAHGVQPTAELVLNATTEIDVYGSASLGEINSATGLPLLSQLTLETPVINGFGGVNDGVSITAGKVTLLGTGTTLQHRNG